MVSQKRTTKKLIDNFAEENFNDLLQEFQSTNYRLYIEKHVHEMWIK